MYNFYVSYATVKEMTAEHAKHIREWERRVQYERAIVRSVPERAIAACSRILDNDERWEPG